MRADAYGYSTGRAKLAAARTALEGMTAASFSGRYYCQVVAHSEPISLGQDETHVVRASRTAAATAR